jgi:hypothetical protein
MYVEWRPKAQKAQQGNFQIHATGSSSWPAVRGHVDWIKAAGQLMRLHLRAARFRCLGRGAQSSLAARPARVLVSVDAPVPNCSYQIESDFIWLKCILDIG